MEDPMLELGLDDHGVEPLGSALPRHAGKRRRSAHRAVPRAPP